MSATIELPVSSEPAPWPISTISPAYLPTTRTALVAPPIFESRFVSFTIIGVTAV